jgi:hypothetical protein
LPAQAENPINSVVPMTGEDQVMTLPEDQAALDKIVKGENTHCG